MRLAIVEAALDRRPDTWRDTRVAHIQIERQMYPARAVAGNRQRLFGDDGNPRAVDVLHGEYVDSGGADDLLFTFVEVTDADEHGVLGEHLGREATDPGQLGGLGAEEGRQRHAMDVAAVGT